MSDYKEHWIEGSYLYTKNTLTGEVSRTVIDHSSDSNFIYEMSDDTFGMFKNKDNEEREGMIWHALLKSGSLEECVKRTNHLLGYEKYK